GRRRGGRRGAAGRCTRALGVAEGQLVVEPRRRCAGRPAAPLRALASDSPGSTVRPVRAGAGGRLDLGGAPTVVLGPRGAHLAAVPPRRGGHLVLLLRRRPSRLSRGAPGAGSRSVRPDLAGAAAAGVCGGGAESAAAADSCGAVLRAVDLSG